MTPSPHHPTPLSNPNWSTHLPTPPTPPRQTIYIPPLPNKVIPSWSEPVSSLIPLDMVHCRYSFYHLIWYTVGLVPASMSVSNSGFPASKDSVLAMFQRTTAGSNLSTPSVSSVSESLAHRQSSSTLARKPAILSTTYNDAQSESLLGFRPKCSISATSAPRKKVCSIILYPLSSKSLTNFFIYFLVDVWSSTGKYYCRYWLDLSFDMWAGCMFAYLSNKLCSLNLLLCSPTADLLTTNSHRRHK